MLNKINFLHVRSFKIQARHFTDKPASTDAKNFFQTLNANLKSLLDKDDEVSTPPNASANITLPENFEDEEEEWVEMFNPDTGEWNGPRHGEPTVHGDWQQKGRTSDFS
eukprot:snap_masked-scaffold_15-processed-gene-10.42-mRNA-1 protein AED:0.51 eAED:0.51 QI:0/-1/0/1/-1/1/1/0/108